uniref:Uncharacterized protein n=1 Tax=Pararge aegeria TaxID=116150 RepID=S4P984_9NEOP
MSSLLNLLSRAKMAKEKDNKVHSELLPPESPLIPAILKISIGIQVEGKINISMIKDYFSLVMLALCHDILDDTPDLKLLLPSLWIGTTKILTENATVHQFSDIISEMICSTATFNAFTENAVIPTGYIPFSTKGIRTWEFQGSENSLLLTVLRYDITVYPGAHHLRDSLRSTGHIMIPYPTSMHKKTLKDLFKWISGKEKTHSQIIEHLLIRLLNHKVESLATTIHTHSNSHIEDLPAINYPSAPPDYSAN